MTHIKDESISRCRNCGAALPSDAEECPECGFGTRTQADPLQVGVVLEGRYRIDAVVGRGGTGVVYRGIDLTLSREIAVKALLERSTDTLTLERFLHEARNLASVEHPGLVPIYAVGQEHGVHYMVMKFLDGSTLAELIKEQGALPERTVRQILSEACEALRALHSAGLVHRDLKPANLMLGRDGKVTVVDLGIVQRVTDGHDASGHTVGTPKYMAPEMLSDEEVTHLADIYSLGVVGYHCLAGKPPFDGPTPMAILYKQAHEEPPQLTSQASGISAQMSEVIHQALSKDQKKRQQSVQEFATQLAQEQTNNRSPLGWSLALFCGALVVLYFSFAGDESQNKDGALAVTPLLDASIRKPVPKTIEKVVFELKAASPKSIELHLDDGQVLSTPYRFEAERNAPQIRLRARAEGYLEREITVSFEQNYTKELSLDKKPTSPVISKQKKRFKAPVLKYDDE